MSVLHEFRDVILREGDLVEHLRDQCTVQPVSAIRLRMLLDWAADEIEKLRASEKTGAPE